MRYLLLFLYFFQLNFVHLYWDNKINARIFSDSASGLTLNMNFRDEKRKTEVTGSRSFRLNNKDKMESSQDEGVEEEEIDEYKDEEESGNNEENLNKAMGDNDNDSSVQDPRCETKYKLVDKLKQLTFLYKLVEKKKILVTIDSCIIEMYEVYYVTLRNTNSLLSVIATVYGWNPFILMALIVLAFFVTFNKTLFYFILVISTNTVLNDILLKNIFKISRPPSSASKSYGMPSGHSCMSISICTFILLHLTKENKNKWHYILSILALITLLPIPWSRVHIGDHTVSQIIVGSLVGIFVGSFWYIFKEKMNMDQLFKS